MKENVLRDLYYKKKLSYRDIGDKFGKTESYAKYWFKKYKLQPRTNNEACLIRCKNKPQTNPGRKDMPKKYNYREEHHNYKGGYIRKDGYRVISVDGEQRLEHRHIWEQHYQKPIPLGYQIHHINYNKLDNRIENLECLSNSEHQQIHLKNLKFNDKGKFIKR